MLLISSLLVMPANDTVWWDTPGGKVFEHRDDAEANCSLMFYNDEGSVTFDWADQNKTLVTAINSNWQFPDDWETPVAMQLGEVWLDNHRDSVIIQAVGHGNAVTFAADQAVDDLLRPADHIVIRTNIGEMSISLPHGKMGNLLSRTRSCRDAAGR
jgi:hypothetical protein